MMKWQLLLTLWALISFANANSKEADPSSGLNVHEESDHKPDKKLDSKIAKQDNKTCLEQDETATTTSQRESVLNGSVFLQKLVGDVGKEDSQTDSLKNISEVDKSNGASVALSSNPPSLAAPRDTRPNNETSSASNDTSLAKLEFPDRIGTNVIITLTGPPG